MECIGNGRNAAHYSAAVVHGGLVYISGQLPVDPATGTVVARGVKQHAEQALANLDAVLHRAGCTRSDVIQCRVYTPDIAHWEAINQVYAEFFGAHKPARCVVPTSELHFGSLVEIEAIAACKED